MADPTALFVTNAITRKGIADDLNGTLGRDEFTDGDERLTDTFCKEYAAALGEINCLDLSEDGHIDAVAEMDTRYLAEFGLKADDE